LVWACKPQQLTLVTVNFPKRGTYLFMYIILKRCIGILNEYLGKMRCNPLEYVHLFPSTVRVIDMTFPLLSGQKVSLNSVLATEF
jgi:hypothetical protein